MNKKISAAILAGVIALVGGWYFWQSSSSPAPAPAPTPVNAPAPAVPLAPPQPPPPQAEAAPRYPLGLPAVPAAALGLGDAPLLKALREPWSARFLALIFSDEVIRRIVITVDNLPRASVPPDAMLFKPVPGAFATAGRGDSLVISRRNAARYAPYVAAVRRSDAARLAGVYVDFYPAFQRAYEELTNSRAYFNDRLVEAIDDLLAAPDPAGAIGLVRTDGHYEFADGELARRSAGQKILLRMGVAHAAVVKAKLRDIRAEVTRGAAPTR